MRLIPNILLSCQSNAERRIFETLRSVDLGSDWTAFHSLNCNEHAYKHWAEIDFLIVGPGGVFVLEVKGGRIKCSDGVWTYTDRFGRGHTSTEGPFVQARTVMYALKGLLRDRYRIEAKQSEQITFGFGVVFPDIDWSLDTPEMPGEIVADRLMTSTPGAFRRYLRGLSEYWSAKYSGRPLLSGELLQKLRQQLRPDVDLYPPFSARVGRTLAEMQRLTDEQYERLEVIEQNDRVVISGGAGTGKTFLMLQCARREQAEGRRVLVVVESPILATHLRGLESDPSLRIESFENLAKSGEPADVLLVDEGQDLLEAGILSELSKHVSGGLDRGRWRWFMDENNQAGLRGAFQVEGLQLLLEGLTSGPPTRVPLLRNCRNTKEIVNQVHLWTGADIGRTEVSGYGAAPSIRSVRDRRDLLEKIQAVLEELIEGDIPFEDIGIVLPIGSTGGLLEELPRNLRRRLVPLDSHTVGAGLTNRIAWGTVERFKGLERPVMLALDFDSEKFAEGRLAELYVASTRANYGLYLFAGPDLVKALEEAVEKNSQALDSQEGGAIARA